MLRKHNKLKVMNYKDVTHYKDVTINIGSSLKMELKNTSPAIHLINSGTFSLQKQGSLCH